MTYPKTFNTLTILPEVCPSCMKENQAKEIHFSGNETAEEREALERKARKCEHCGNNLYEAGRQALGI